MKSKKILSAVLASAMVITLAGFAGGSAANAFASENESSGSEPAESSEDDVTITFLYTKSELAGYIEEAAEKYSEEHDGVTLEVAYPTGKTVSFVETSYTLGQPYTLIMLDPFDFYSLGEEYGMDMSGQDWVDETDYAGIIDGEVVGFPFSIEARGIIYNADAIEKATGEKFDPDDIIYLSDFIEFLEKLVSDGMEFPTVVQKTYWSLGYHYLDQVYEERDSVDTFIARLYAGKVDMLEDVKLNALLDTLDVLIDFNYFQNSPTNATDSQVYQVIAEGDAAFKFGGCWEWASYADFDRTENMGIMPVPQNIEDNYTGSLVGGVTKYVYIDDSEYTTDEQREAALDFLDWLVYSDEGQELIVDTFDLVSPFRNNDVVSTNPLAVSVKEYADAEKLIPTYDYMPGDHEDIMGTAMLDYLGGSLDRRQLALAIEEYWVSATPVSN